MVGRGEVEKWDWSRQKAKGQRLKSLAKRERTWLQSPYRSPYNWRPVWSLNLHYEVASRRFERDPLANKTLFTHQVIDHISQAFLTSNTTSHSSDLLVMRVSMAMLGSIKHVTGEDQACHDNNNNNASPHALEASTRLLAWNTYSSSY